MTLRPQADACAAWHHVADNAPVNRYWIAFRAGAGTRPKYFRSKYKATFTRLIRAGTSTKGPITAAKAAPELMPNTATATAMASSKLLLAAVKERVAVFE
jgi:hypothetical protein